MHTRTDPGPIGMLDLPGPAGVPPLVALHGWTRGKGDFAEVASVLAEDRRVLVPDLPGHGDSPAAGHVDGYALPALAAWVLAVLDAEGVGEFHLLGHSLGGLLAQRVAHDAAHRLTSLTLLGTGLGAVGEDTGERVLRIALTARDEGLDAAAALVHGSGEEPRAVEERTRFRRLDVDAVVGGARALTTAAPLGAFLRGMDFPVLVCHGEEDDVWLPHEQRLLARTIPGAAYRVVPATGHAPVVEDPDALLAVVRPFLAHADAAARGTTVWPHTEPPTRGE